MYYGNPEITPPRTHYNATPEGQSGRRPLCGTRSEDKRAFAQTSYTRLVAHVDCLRCAASLRKRGLLPALETPAASKPAAGANRPAANSGPLVTGSYAHELALAWYDLWFEEHPLMQTA